MSDIVSASQNVLTQREQQSALAAAQRYANKSRADSTWRAYTNDWRQFEAWCGKVALPVLPAEPETIAMFVASQSDAGLAPSTINRRLAAIRLVHLGAGAPSPHNAVQVAEVMRGIRRSWGKPPAQKAAALSEDIKKMADATDPNTKMGLRDRAILLFGFAGAFRRSELVALDVSDLEEREEGLKVTIASSKTDQEAQGQSIAIVRQLGSQYCPVEALQAWMQMAEIQHGALFRRIFRGDSVSARRLSPQSVALIVKEYASRAGLDWERYAGHSLRRGFLTSAARNKADIFKMANQSRHRSLEVLRDYVSAEKLFEDNAGYALLGETKNGTSNN